MVVSGSRLPVPSEVSREESGTVVPSSEDTDPQCPTSVMQQEASQRRFPLRCSRTVTDLPPCVHLLTCVGLAEGAMGGDTRWEVGRPCEERALGLAGPHGASSVAGDGGSARGQGAWTSGRPGPPHPSPHAQPRPLSPFGHAATAHCVPACSPALERSRFRRAIDRHGARDAAPSMV